jgi:hypothetical protein
MPWHDPVSEQVEGAGARPEPTTMASKDFLGEML